MGSVLRILGGVRSDWFVIGACLVGAAFCFVDGNWYAVLGWLTGAFWSLVAYVKAWCSACGAELAWLIGLPGGRR